jgi:hypothetical protein
MMYHNTSNTNGNCSGPVNGSPNSTPPNINACSSTTPPLSSGQTNQSDGNGNEMVEQKNKKINSLINNSIETFLSPEFQPATTTRELPKHQQ